MENPQLATIGHSALRVKTYVFGLIVILRRFPQLTSHLGGEPGQDFYSSRLIQADRRPQRNNLGINGSAPWAEDSTVEHQ